MNRKKFVAATLAAIPALAFARIPSFYTNEANPFVVRAGKNRANNSMMKFMGIHDNDVVISRKDTGEELSAFLFHGYKGATTSLHMHLKQDEFFHVISGTYLFVCGELRETLAEGDTIFLPRKIPHQWLQTSPTGSLIYAVNPAGTLEDMFVEFDNFQAPPTIDELKEIHRRHDMELIGPPLSLES